MRFRDYSAEFAPSPDIFRLAGRGLGSDVRGAVRKAARRPLFKKLADRFRTGNEAKAELNTLAQMGLQAPPMQGDTQYPIFQDIKAHHLSMLNQRPDRAQEMFPLDEQGAMDYLTGEDKLYAAKGGKGKDGEEANPIRTRAKEALVKAAQDLYRAGFAAGETPSHQNWAAFEEAKLNLIGAKADYADAGGDPNKILDSQSQVMTTVKSLQELKNLIANIKGKETGVINTILDKIYDTVDKVLAKPRINKWLSEAAAVAGSAEAIQRLADNFEAVKDKPNELFELVKQLGRAIEPGLQVTTEEVKGFLGANAISAFIGGISETGEALKSLLGTKGEGGLLRKAQTAAATSQPKIMWDIIIQATHVISKAQKNYAAFLREAKQNAKEIGDADTKARTMYASSEEKQVIESAVKTYIEEQLSQKAQFEQIQPIPYGTPMGQVSTPDTPPPGDKSEWGTDFSAYEAGEYDAELKKRIESAEASSTLNPIKKEVSKGAAAVATKAQDDILDQLLAPKPEKVD
jgi:hypothetical protein